MTVPINSLLRAKRDEILRIAARHGVTRIRLIGSVARGEETPASDIVFLIDVGPSTSAWFPGSLINDLEDLLGRRIDIVTERGLRPELRERVLRDARPL